MMRRNKFICNSNQRNKSNQWLADIGSDSATRAICEQVPGHKAGRRRWRVILRGEVGPQGEEFDVVHFFFFFVMVFGWFQSLFVIAACVLPGMRGPGIAGQAKSQHCYACLRIDMALG